MKNKLLVAVNDFFKRNKINPVLASIQRSARFKEMENEFYSSFLIQTSQLLRTDFLKQIKDSIGKQEEPIWTDTDSIEVRKAIEENFKPLSEFLSLTSLMGYYIWLSEIGGQSFLDKAGIRLEFNLTNKDMIGQLIERTDLLITTVDDTTKEWIGNQIIEGKKIGLSDVDIANKLREKIPETYKYRTERIVRTEMAEIVNRTEFETAVNNNASGKKWITVGDERVSEACAANEDEGLVGMNATFSSGHSRPPEHPNCRCLLEYSTPLIVHSKVGWTGQ